MKIKVYYFGKANEVTDWEEKYLKRIGFRASIELVALSQGGKQDQAKNKQLEADLFFKKIEDRDYVIALDEGGRDLDSITFSEHLKTQLVEHGTVVFVMGGAYGLEASVLKRAQLKIAFGKAVWTRNLVRLMLLEQLYRALEIDGGSHFHKA